MGVLSIYTTSLPAGWNETNRLNAFCDCANKGKNALNATQVPKPCDCGVNDCQTLEWTWDTKEKLPQTRITGCHISFHPSYSQGTSIVRGTKELQKGYVHYWEIKIDSLFPGTDLVRFLLRFIGVYVTFLILNLPLCFRWLALERNL